MPHVLIHDLIRGLADLVLAPTCVGCRGPIASRSDERLICGRCLSRARPIPPPRCERCWNPIRARGPGIETACALCPELRPAIRAIRSAVVLDDVSRPIVHALKYRGWHAVATPVGRLMASVSWPHEVDADSPVVVPVPLSRVRRRERGYNQAALLAAEIAAVRAWESVPEALERARSAGSQTTLHPTERRANVAGAFRAGEAGLARIAARHVLIVDDVWTTGATALACADALLEAGARAASVLTYARALPELERDARRIELAHT